MKEGPGCGGVVVARQPTDSSWMLIGLYGERVKLRSVDQVLDHDEHAARTKVGRRFSFSFCTSRPRRF